MCSRDFAYAYVAVTVLRTIPQSLPQAQDPLVKLPRGRFMSAMSMPDLAPTPSQSTARNLS